MERVELLVAQLYSPTAAPEIVQSAQRGIQEIQKSSDGWNIGCALLETADPKAQFLGAQTLLVKLNDGIGLPEWSELRRILTSLIDSIVARQYTAFVVRKILSVCVKAYLNSSHWPEFPADVVKKLYGLPQYVSDFLTIIVEDSELDAAASRAKLVPAASDVAHHFFKSAGFNSEEVLHAFTVWAIAFFDVFRDLIGDLIGLLSQNTSELAVYSSLRELYIVHWRAWQPRDRKQLTDTLFGIASKYSVLPPPDFTEDEVFVAYMQLVIAICLEDFEANTELHPIIFQVATASVPVVNDPLAVEALDFWNQYTEEVISSGMSSESNELIAQVISSYLPRIRLYPGLRQSDWEEFSSFRKDFADFLELSYPLLGSQMFDHLTDIVLNSLSKSETDWESIETALFCLNGLADIIGEDYRGDKPEFRNVQRIFQSNLWEALPQCDNVRVRQTAVNVIGCFVDFFLSPEGQPHLAVTLTYLFSSLATPMLQNTASRSIQKLCNTCRAQLVNEVPAFLAVYSDLTRYTHLGTVPHVRTVGGIACVIQAMLDATPKAEALNQLLTMVIASSQNTDDVESQRNSLKCVAAIGKNMQAPEPKTLHYTGFWLQDSVASSVHARLQWIVRSMIRTNELEEIELICEILKSGMVEHEGPFVFSQDEIIDFVKTKFEIGPMDVMGPVVDMSRFFISTQLATAKSLRRPAFSQDIIAGFMGVARQAGHESASQSLDLLTQLLAACEYAEQDFVQITGGPEALSEVALPGMGSTDRFVLRSAATFWSSYAAKARFDIEALGMQLVHALLLQISGQASRSDLLPITEVLKAMLQKHPLGTMNWLKAQVVDAPSLRNILKQEPKVRTNFLAQLALVKGNRKTGEIVQRFWLGCRGIPESYVPVK